MTEKPTTEHPTTTADVVNDGHGGIPLLGAKADDDRYAVNADGTRTYTPKAIAPPAVFGMIWLSEEEKAAPAPTAEEFASAQQAVVDATIAAMKAGRALDAAEAVRNDAEDANRVAAQHLQRTKSALQRLTERAAVKHLNA